MITQKDTFCFNLRQIHSVSILSLTRFHLLASVPLQVTVNKALSLAKRVSISGRNGWLRAISSCVNVYVCYLCSWPREKPLNPWVSLPAQGTALWALRRTLLVAPPFYAQDQAGDWQTRVRKYSEARTGSQHCGLSITRSPVPPKIWICGHGVRAF